MNRATRLTLAALLVFAAAGCEKTTATDSLGRKLTLSRPMDQSLKRGELDKIDISVGRSGFNTAVAVRFENLPKGLEVVEQDLKIPADRSTRTFTLHAANDAALVANHEVRVVAEGPEGLSTAETFRVTVKEKDQASSGTGN